MPQSDLASPRTVSFARVSSRQAVTLVLSIAAVSVVCDQLVKHWAIVALENQPPVYLVGDWLRLLFVRNPGAAFSMGADSTIIISLFGIAFAIGLVIFSARIISKLWAILIGMFLGGALGNIVDRVFRAPEFLHGHVVDYVAVGWWPVFNLADALLTVAGVGLMYAVIRDIPVTQTALHEQRRAKAGQDD